MIQLLEKITIKPTKCLYTMSKQLKAKDDPKPSKYQVKNSNKMSVKCLEKKRRKEKKEPLFKKKYKVVEKNTKRKSQSPALKDKDIKSIKADKKIEGNNSKDTEGSRSPGRQKLMMRSVIDIKKSKLRKIQENKIKESKYMRKIQQQKKIDLDTLFNKKDVKFNSSHPKLSVSPTKLKKLKEEELPRGKNITTFKSLKNFVDNSTGGYNNNLKTRLSLNQKMSPLVSKGKNVKVARNSSKARKRNHMKSHPNTRRETEDEPSRYKGYFKKLSGRQEILSSKKRSKVSQRVREPSKENKESKEKDKFTDSINTTDIFKRRRPRSKRRLMKPFKRIENSNDASRNNSQASCNIRELRTSSRTDLIKNFQGSLRSSSKMNQQKLKLLSSSREESLKALAFYTKNTVVKSSAEYRNDLLSFQTKKFQYRDSSRSKEKIYTGSLDEIQYNQYKGTYNNVSKETLSQSNLDFTSLKKNFQGARKKFSGYEDEKKKQFHLESNGSIDDYIFKGRKLGIGAYAIVRPAKSKLTGNLVAVKTFNKLQLTSPEIKESVKNEVEIIKEVNHPSIVDFIDRFENRRNIHLIMEYAGRVNLKTKIDKKKGFMNYDEIKRIFSKIVEAVAYLHSINIVHCDLKLENVVLNRENVKLVDFGFARKGADKEAEIIAGTPNYMSPELIKREKHWPKPADVWSLGVILYYMITKRFPFTGKKETDLMLSVLQAEPDYDLINNFYARMLLKKILKKEASERIQASEILDSEFLRGTVKVEEPIVVEVVNVEEENIMEDIVEIYDE